MADKRPFSTHSLVTSPVDDVEASSSRDPKYLSGSTTYTANTTSTYTNDNSPPRISPPIPASGSRSRNGNGNGNGHDRVDSNGNGVANANGNGGNGHPNGYFNFFSPPPSYATNSRPASSRRSTVSRGVNLGRIDEDSTNTSPDSSYGLTKSTSSTPPEIPTRSPKRVSFVFDTKNLIASIFPHSKPSRLLEDDVPEKEVYGPRGEKFSDLRNNTLKTAPPRKRDFHHWSWRVWAGVLLVFIILIALAAIGLVVGLKVMHHHHSSTSSSNSTSNSTHPITTFPVGTYAITTPLLTITTACTSNPATWRCYPYQTYNESQSASLTTLNWIVTGQNNTATGDINYSITSSTDPFALPFSTTPLTLVNSGLATEYYTFSVAQSKLVVPSSSIVSDGSAVNCNYSAAKLSARLYTKREPTIGTGDGSGGWPYAVEVSQTSEGGPDCYEVVNGGRGQSVGVAAQSGECECIYGDVEG